MKQISGEGVGSYISRFSQCVQLIHLAALNGHIVSIHACLTVLHMLFCVTGLMLHIAGILVNQSCQLVPADPARLALFHVAKIKRVG